MKPPDPPRSKLVSVLVVNFDGRAHLRRCLDAFARQSHPEVEILVVDNGSRDGSHLDVDGFARPVRVLENPRNGYAAALNLGLRHARGEHVVFANNDVFPEPDWVASLVSALERAPDAGCAGGKLLFEDGRINSVGHRALPGFYFEDEGFGEEDHGQYETPREVDGVCWAAVMFRRICLDALGPLDEDYVLYYEDVDTSLRCRRAGWKILYEPTARARHRFHGSSDGPYLTEHFCDRNRLVFLAKHEPQELPEAIRSSRFVERGELGALHAALVVAVAKLLELHPKEIADAILADVRRAAEPLLGGLAVDHVLRRVEVILGARPMSVAFYDHALHTVGGGQRYGCEMAVCLAEGFDVTLLTNHPVDERALARWYGLELDRVRIRTVPLPAFPNGETPDVNLVGPDDENPFDAVARASADYDVLVNVNMLSLVAPLSPYSIFLCHFPDMERRDRFGVDDYSCLLTNSEYTEGWTQRRWGIQADAVLYPPVAMASPRQPKEKIILSAARFEVGGSKKQHVLIHAFERLRAEHPTLTRGWRLVLVGGSLESNRHRDRVARLIRHSDAPIEMHVNASSEEMRSLYARASVFWHACGLGESDPHLIEHFGMTTVEAMQNGCVPIVFDGGGMREIVEDGRSGYRFRTMLELVEITARTIHDAARMEAVAEAARKRGARFSRAVFVERVEALFGSLRAEYGTMPAPDPRDLLRGEPREDRFFGAAARRMEASPTGSAIARRETTTAPDPSLLDRVGGLGRAVFRLIGPRGGDGD